MQVQGRRRLRADAPVVSGGPDVIVDLNELTFMDASTLGVLVAARRHA